MPLNIPFEIQTSKSLVFRSPLYNWTIMQTLSKACANFSPDLNLLISICFYNVRLYMSMCVLKRQRISKAYFQRKFALTCSLDIMMKNHLRISSTDWLCWPPFFQLKPFTLNFLTFIPSKLITHDVIFLAVGSVLARLVPQDGSALLHCEEQGPSWSCGSQEDNILHCHHRSKFAILGWDSPTQLKRDRIGYHRTIRLKP